MKRIPLEKIPKYAEAIRKLPFMAIKTEGQSDKEVVDNWVWDLVRSDYERLVNENIKFELIKDIEKEKLDD